MIIFVKVEMGSEASDYLIKYDGNDGEADLYCVYTFCIHFSYICPKSPLSQDQNRSSAPYITSGNLQKSLKSMEIPKIFRPSAGFSEVIYITFQISGLRPKKSYIHERKLYI